MSRLAKMNERDAGVEQTRLNVACTRSMMKRTTDLNSPWKQRGTVNISAKIEYACIAMLELASQYQGRKPVRIRTIAQRHGIPARFLVQILLQLKAAGLVQSTRGAAGGYQLTRDPALVTLCDVTQILDGRPETITSNTENPTPISITLLDAWNQVRSQQTEMLQSITLAELTQRAEINRNPMYYI